MSRSTTARPPSQFLASRDAVLDDKAQIPLHFGNPSQELAAFADSAALISRADTTRLLHEGEDALDLLNRLSTNDLLQLAPGRSALTVLTTERGRIIDLLRVARLDEQRLLLLSESNDPKPAAEWIDRFTIIEDAVIRDVSGELAGFAVIGPTALHIVHTAFGAKLKAGDVVSPDDATGDVMLVASEWGSVPRIDVMVSESLAEQTWERLAGAGAVPAGELAFHASRVGQGIPFPGFELTDSANPLEAGLKGAISFTKGCYVGQEVVARLDTYDRLQKRLMALDSDSELVAGSALTQDGKRAGAVTSVSPLQVSGARTAMGYVRRGSWEDGTELSCGDATVTVRDLSER